ncbi:hypothetical protein BBK36DRAFT_1128560, partial [Trichoderma citrinoviride]
QIACNRGSPCSSCDIAKIRCTHTTVVSRPREQGQRILISAQYEKKIDNISEGINEIKRLLRERSQSPKAHHPSHRIDLDSPPVKDTPENGRQSPCPFTGESSFTAHSLDAKRFVESIAAQTSLDGSDLERDDLLACLRELLRYKNDQIVVHQMSFLDEPISTSIARTTEEVTPLEAAVFILRWAKESSSSYIVTWISQILPLERIIGICQKVYFSVHDYSEVEFIIANGCLYWLYWEYAALFKRPEFQQYGIQCRDNIQLAFSRLPFLLPASMEVIAAMVIGALHAIELCKDLLAWTFSSSASHLCQTLGYHQQSFFENDSKSIKMAKQRLFFTVYRIDKGLSLRLGRSSNIQEYNVSLPCEPMEMRWNQSASIQARVYDELYSSFGLSRPLADRESSVAALSSELQILIDPALQSFEHTTTPESTDVLRKVHIAAERVELLSVLTLIHRAVATLDNGISSDCFTAARRAMDAHQSTIASLKACTDEPMITARYINRVVLHTPFVPFIVLFRRCIEMSEPVDLSRLSDFVMTLEALESSTKPARRRQRLFQLLYKVARLYVESGASPKTWSLGFLDDEFNHYLSILGFATTATYPTQEPTRAMVSNSMDGISWAS